MDSTPKVTVLQLNTGIKQVIELQNPMNATPLLDLALILAEHFGIQIWDIKFKNMNEVFNLAEVKYMDY